LIRASRAEISPFELSELNFIHSSLFELILPWKFDEDFPAEQLEAAPAQSTVPSPALSVGATVRHASPIALGVVDPVASGLSRGHASRHVMLSHRIVLGSHYRAALCNTSCCIVCHIDCVVLESCDIPRLRDIALHIYIYIYIHNILISIHYYIL